MARSPSKKDPIVDNLPVAPSESPSPVASGAVVVAGTENTNAAETDTPAVVRPKTDPMTATQVVIAETEVVSGNRPLVAREQAPPKQTTKLENGTIRLDY